TVDASAIQTQINAFQRRSYCFYAFDSLVLSLVEHPFCMSYDREVALVFSVLHHNISPIEPFALYRLYRPLQFFQQPLPDLLLIYYMSLVHCSSSLESISQNPILLEVMVLTWTFKSTKMNLKAQIKNPQDFSAGQ